MLRTSGDIMSKTTYMICFVDGDYYDSVVNIEGAYSSLEKAADAAFLCIKKALELHRPKMLKAPWFTGNNVKEFLKVSVKQYYKRKLDIINPYGFHVADNIYYSITPLHVLD